MCSARTSSLLHSGLTLSPSGHPHARSLALPNTPHSLPISLPLALSLFSSALAGWLAVYIHDTWSLLWIAARLRAWSHSAKCRPSS